MEKNSGNALICLYTEESYELDYLKRNFYGSVYTGYENLKHHGFSHEECQYYVCGDIDKIGGLPETIWVIRELSKNISNVRTLVSIKDVPVDYSKI